jgi:hypothetical protein
VKAIPIYLLSYYFEDTLFDVIDRLNEITKVPIKIIVGDNFSENSNQIRKKLADYKHQNKIHSSYFYPENHGTKIIKHMVYAEGEKSEYIVIGDGDALINSDSSFCWLSDFLKILNDPKIGLIAFQSKNESLPVAMENKKRDSLSFKISSKDSHTTFSAKEVLAMPASPVRGHFMTLKTASLYEYYQNRVDGDGTYDGGLQRFLASKNYSIAKYTRSFTYNLGTIKAGYDCDGLNQKYPVDLKYKNIRKVSWDNFTFPKNYKKI